MTDAGTVTMTQMARPPSPIQHADQSRIIDQEVQETIAKLNAQLQKPHKSFKQIAAEKKLGEKALASAQQQEATPDGDNEEFDEANDMIEAAVSKI